MAPAIWDEMQTGFGRVGRMFAAELYETLPDILIFGKAIGGGFPVVKIKLPLVITDAQAERVMDVFEEVAQLLSP